MDPQQDRPIFGIHVLETLTTGMYTNPLDAIRELVQNACDSLWEAERVGLVRPSEAKIEITIDPTERTLCVRDNGIGIPADLVRSRLTNVGSSVKNRGDENDSIGFRGIGRLHGIAYCEHLAFKTSYSGEAHSSRVEFDARGLRSLMMSGYNNGDRADDILYAATDIKSHSESADLHYFEATLHNVSPEVPQLLDYDAVHSYLCQVTPVDFNTGFIWMGKIERWAKEHGVPVPHVSIVLRSRGNKERCIYKPYKTSYPQLREARDQDKKGERIEIKDICFFPDNPLEEGFWVWYSRGNLPGQIGDPDAAGLRLRSHNMSVGGADRIDELLKESRFNRYFIGEVHVIAPECRPNARRDGFEDTPEWAKIRDSLVEFMKLRQKDVRDDSIRRSNPVTKSIKAAIQIANRASSEAITGLNSNEQRTSLLADIEVRRAALQELPETRILPEQQAQIESALLELDRAVDTVENSGLVLDKAKGRLDRKQRKLLQMVLAVLQNCLPEDMFRTARAAIMDTFETKDEK